MEKNLIIDIKYNSIKSQISRNLNKKLSSNVITFAKIPIKLFREYNDDIFVDGTFFIAPKFSYQIFLTRTYAKELVSFYTTSFAILQNKKQETYKIFKKLKEKMLIHKNKRNLENKKKRTINKANEISVLIECYKNIETKLIDTKCDKNNTINLWFDCLTDLNNII
ncbi:hypothetical protein U3516DRAFT_804169 [Neocallimastix sp. 'constans']